MAEQWVCKVTDLTEDRGVLCTVGGRVVGLFKVGNAIYAYDNRCPHMGGPVCQGDVVPWVEEVVGPDGAVVAEREHPARRHVACPWHGFEFDLATGLCVANPRYRLRAFAVSVRGDDVYIAVED